MPLSLRSRSSAYAHNRDMHRRSIAKRRLVRTIAAVVVIVLLFIVIGFVYTWYSGRYQQPVSVNQAMPQAIRHQEKAPAVIADDADVGVARHYFTPKVVPGKNASMMIKSNPTIACSIVVEYNKVASQDSGLVPKKTDEYGIASWSWTVEEGRPYGSWPVTVTCANKKHSAMLREMLEVVKP